MPPLKVLIVGAGIAGNALAFWLSKLGHRVTVIERHSALRVNGLQLDLRGNGIEVMKRMGLEQAIRAKCVPEEGFAVVDSTGRRRAFFAANRSGKGAQSISSEFEIMRGDLCRVLHDAAVENGARYRFAVSLQGFVEEDGGVEVKLTDGVLEKFDLVAGCDGQGSRVRRLMLGGGSLDGDVKDSVLTTLPQRIGYFTIRRPIQEAEQYVATVYMMPEKRFLLLRRHREDEMQVYLKAETSSGSGQLKNVNRGDVKAEKQAFAELFQGSGWRTDEVVKALQEDAEDFYCQYSGVVKMDSWSRGRVTLVGDAGYGCPPDGFGTSVALLGAYVLAGEISNYCRSGERTASEAIKSEGAGKHNDDDDGVLNALKAYEDNFQPYMRQIQKGYSAEPNMFDKLPWTPLTIGLFYRVMSIAAFLKLDRIAARFAPSESVKGWQLPAYEDMVKN